MPDVPRGQIVLYALAALAVVFLGLRQLARDHSPAAAAPSPAATIRVEQTAEAAAVVHVAGAVRRPGVYRMRPGERVDDAVRRAGGATARADLSGLNLAAKVQDGRQVLVPRRGRAAPAGTTGSAAPGAATAPVNLNTATLEQLDALEGIGPGIAQQILDHREAIGGFASIEELDRIPGIGAARLAALRERVTL